MGDKRTTEHNMTMIQLFQVAHMVHQAATVENGHCYARCTMDKVCVNINCDFLGPYHAYYDMWFKRYMILHAVDGDLKSVACSDAGTEIGPETCLPGIFPLQTIADQCVLPEENGYTYDYEEWLSKEVEEFPT